MIQIQLSRGHETVVLRVRGTLDGAGAWRLLRLCARLQQRRAVLIDLSEVEAVLAFAAAVLGSRLPAMAPRVTLSHVRPEHVPLLEEAGLLLHRARQMRDIGHRSK